jgi:hypothetical protein
MNRPRTVICSFTVDALVEHCERWACRYQFDNDPVFVGAIHPDTIGRARGPA